MQKSRILGLQRDLGVLTDACKMWGRLLAKIELAALSEYPDTLDVLPEIAEAKSAVDTIYRVNLKRSGSPRDSYGRSRDRRPQFQ